MSTQLISPVSHSNSAVNQGPISSNDARLRQFMKSYQADQQLKYLHLQAEIEVLLQELQTLKQQRLREAASEN